jgi:two-component system chemotaxis response regulator CheY
MTEVNPMFDKNITILVAEDMKSQRIIIKKTLIDMGYQNVTEAEDGFEALDLVEKNPKRFDLIISDYAMPKCNGLEFLKRLRAKSMYASVPFIMLTTENNPVHIASAIDAGVTDYVLKPINPVKFPAKLADVYKKVYGS